jgi:hypothetical protein
VNTIFLEFSLPVEYNPHRVYVRYGWWLPPHFPVNDYLTFFSTKSSLDLTMLGAKPLSPSPFKIEIETLKQLYTGSMNRGTIKGALISASPLNELPSVYVFLPHLHQYRQSLDQSTHNHIDRERCGTTIQAGQTVGRDFRWSCGVGWSSQAGDNVSDKCIASYFLLLNMRHFFIKGKILKIGQINIMKCIFILCALIYCRCWYYIFCIFDQTL